ncbi:hypothetical protein PV327_007480, partial [Microctonus hyperodae]
NVRKKLEIEKSSKFLKLEPDENCNDDGDDVNTAAAAVAAAVATDVGRLWHVIVAAAALRGVAIQRGRVGPAARAAFPASAAALALARNPGPLAAAAAATALHPFAPAVYYDPFLAAHAATQDPNYRLQIHLDGVECNEVDYPPENELVESKVLWS